VGADIIYIYIYIYIYFIFHSDCYQTYANVIFLLITVGDEALLFGLKIYYTQ